jgi:hypothetical protein
MKRITITPDSLADFRASWPCSGMNKVAHILATLDDAGDLVDIRFLCAEMRDLPEEATVDIDGSALSALLRESA